MVHKIYTLFCFLFIYKINKVLVILHSLHMKKELTMNVSCLCGKTEFQAALKNHDVHACQLFYVQPDSQRGTQ